MLCIPSQLYKWSGLADWTRDIEEQIIPLCRFVQFTYDAFKKFCLLRVLPHLRNLQRIHHKHVLSVLDVTMWKFWLRNWIACILKISPIFLLFFLEFLITLSFLNDCYNKENCSLCVALFWYILIIYPEAEVCSFWILMLLCM